MRPLVRLAAAALAMSVGAVGGLATSYFFRPTDAEVRSAVRSLVPSAMAVTHEGHGKRGSSIGPTLDPYIAVLQTSGGPADPEERVELFRRQAETTGWRQVSFERSPNAVDLLYVRNGIRGGVAVILKEPVTFLDQTGSRCHEQPTRHGCCWGCTGGAHGLGCLGAGTPNR